MELASAEKQRLLELARAAVAAAVRQLPLPEADESALSPAIRAMGASFVTLRHHGELRGCLGGLEPHEPLYRDVCHHAAQSATQDHRFTPVTPAEVSDLQIEVSVLTPPQPLNYTSPADLLQHLRPGVDGVTLELQHRRATFLPQVWERVPEPDKFLGMLCEKMGLPADTWRKTKLGVQVYQAEHFSEPEH